MKSIRSIIILAGLLLATTAIPAADIVWTNTAGGNWSNATNWSPNTVPGAADTALITNAGTYTVTINTAAAVTNLTLGGASGIQTLANSSFTLTLNGASFVGTNGVFAMDVGAVLTGAGNLNVAGLLNWTGGTMSGSGRTIITNGATIAVSGFSFGKTLNRFLDLFGNGSITGTTVNAGNSVFFNVYPGATFDFLSDTGIGYTGGGGVATLSNAGLVRKTGGAATASVGMILNNTGTVRSQSGMLSFNQGGLSSGNFDAHSNAVVNFGGGTHVMTNGISFTASGGGYHRCDGGTLAFEVPYTFNPQFNLDVGGILGGSQNVNFTSQVNWTGGTMSGTGRTIVTNGATMAISGFSYGKTLHRSLDLFGNGSFTGTTFVAGLGVFFNVFGSATFDFLSDNGWNYSGAGGFATLSNNGLVRKTAGAGTTSVALILNNTGTVRSQSGVLSFTVGGLSSGNFDSISNAVVNFGGGTHVMTNGVSFTASGGGYHRCDGGTLAFEVPYSFTPQFNLDVGGTLGGSQNVNFTSQVNWLGGTMSGTGRTIITNGATLTISGNSYGKTLTRNLDLYGNGSFTGLGLNAGNSVFFNVFPSATFDYLNDSAWGYTGGGGVATLSNAGLVRKTAGVGTTSINLILNNTGIVRSQSGDLSFVAGGLSSGSFDAISGSAVSFGGGNHVMTNGVSFTASGGGFHRCNGGTLAFEVPYTFNPQFNLDVGGTLGGSQNVNFTSQVNWLGGTMSGAGRTIVTNGATLTISGNSYGKTLHRNLDLYGNGSFTGITFVAGLGVFFNVFPSATFDFLNDTGWNYSGAGSFATLSNAGLVRKAAGAGTTSVALILNNTGTVRSQSGVLSFNVGGLSSGLFDSISNAVVNFGGGTHTMTNGISFTASGGGYHRCDGGTLAFEVPYTFNPQFNLDVGGTLAGSQNVNFTSQVNWLGGTMSGTGRTIITNGATLTISGNSYGKTLHRNLDLYGNGSFTGITFVAGLGVFFNVFPSATFDYLNDTAWSYSGAGAIATLSNAGLVRKTAGAGTTSITLILNNTGTVRSQSGQLSFNQGGLSSGNFDSISNAIVNFGGGTHVMTNGIAFTASGGGYHRCDGGTLAFEVPYTFNPQFNLDAGGTLAGSQNINFTSTLNWLGGTMSGAGRTIITNGATLTISGNSYGKTLHRNLDLYGNGSFTGITFVAGLGVSFNVYPSATFDYLNDTAWSYSGAGAVAVLQNSGTVRKTGGAGTTSLNLVVTNDGTFSAQSGTLNFQNIYRQNSGQTVLAGGHYQALLLNINGGSLTGSGNILGPVRNNSAIQPGSPLGFLNVTNTANFTNTAAGTYFIQLGGTNHGATYDTIRVAGTANLSGTLNLSFTNGFIPPIGSIYTAMTYTARSGTFTNSNASLLGFVELYTPTNFLLIASNAMPQISFTVDAGLTQMVCRPFYLSAQAFDLDGTITNLALLVNGSPILSGTNTSVETTLELDFPGSYTLEARAYDDKGAIASSNRPVELYAPLHFLTPAGLLTNDAFKFCMIGQTGSNYTVLSSTNLIAPPATWSPVGAMEYTNGIFRYTVTNMLTNGPFRYYRAKQQ